MAALNDDVAWRRAQLTRLTGAEQRILELRALGATVAEIAALLSIPDGVAVVGLAHVIRKLGLEHLSAPARLIEFSEYLPVLALLTREGVPPAPREVVVGPVPSHGPPEPPESLVAGVLADEALLTLGRRRRSRERLPGRRSRLLAGHVGGRFGSRSAAWRPPAVQVGRIAQAFAFVPTPTRDAGPSGVGPSIAGRRLMRMAHLAPAVSGAPDTRSRYAGPLRSWASRVGAASALGAVALVLWLALGSDSTWTRWRGTDAGRHSPQAAATTAPASAAGGAPHTPLQNRELQPANGRGDHAPAAVAPAAEAALERAAQPAGAARVPAPGVPDSRGGSLSETARGTVLGTGEAWLQGGLRVAVKDPLPLPAQGPCGPGLAFTLVVANETQRDLFGAIDRLDWIAIDGSGHRYGIALLPEHPGECPAAGPGEGVMGWFGPPSLISRSFDREYHFVVADPDARLTQAQSIRILIPRLASVRDATWEIPLSPRRPES